MVEAIILAGGLGTRLVETVPGLPKALAPIRGIPFLALQLQQLEMSGIISKVVMALGHKASDIKAYLKHKSNSFPIEFSIESVPLGTGGAVLHALPKTNSKTLLVMNGDSFSDISLSSFLDFHKRKNAEISIVCREMEDVGRYGTLVTDPSYRIRSFQEKSPLGGRGLINGGIYLIERELLNVFSEGRHSLEKDFLPSFLEKTLFAYPHSGAFIDIGIPNSYSEAQEILKPWIIQ